MSAIWQYFTVESPTSKWGTCMLCKSTVSRGGTVVSKFNTSNLIQHLRTHHANEYAEFTEAKADRQDLLQQVLEMPTSRSPTKKCVFCHTQLSVACKICKTCNAEQPRRLRLKRKMDRFEWRQESWVHGQQQHRAASHIRDEAHMLLEKLHALGMRAALLMANPGGKADSWTSEVLIPCCHLTETSSTCLQRIKDIFDIVVQGWTPQDVAVRLEELPEGPPVVPVDLQLTLALLDPRTASAGLPVSPAGGSPPVMGPPIHQAASEQQCHNLEKEPSSVCLEGGGHKEIKTERGNSPAPSSAPVTSAQDIGSTSNHTENLGVEPLLLVTVFDSGFDGDMKDDLEGKGETHGCGGDRQRRQMGPEMSGYESGCRAFTTGHTYDAASKALQRRIKEECTEAVYGDCTAKSLRTLVKYESTDAASSTHDTPQLLPMISDTRAPQTARASDMTQSNTVQVPPFRLSTNPDLDKLDLDQLKREKIKMQIKVLRLQEEYYIQKIRD